MEVCLGQCRGRSVKPVEDANLNQKLGRHLKTEAFETEGEARAKVARRQFWLPERGT